MHDGKTLTLHLWFFIFFLQSPKEEHVLSAPSPEECAEWVECINSSIKMFTDDLEAEQAANATAAGTYGGVNISIPSSISSSVRHVSRGVSRTGSRSSSRTHSPSPSLASPMPPPPQTPRSASSRTRPTSSSLAIANGMASDDRCLAQTLPAAAVSRTSYLEAVTNGDEDNFDTDANGSAPHASPMLANNVNPSFQQFQSFPSRLKRSATGLEPSSAARKQLFVSTGSAETPQHSLPSTTPTLTPASIGVSPSPQRTSKALSLQASSSIASRHKVAAALSEADQLRLDAFTLRTQSSILDDDNDTDFGSHENDFDSTASFNHLRSQGDAHLYDDEAAETPLPPQPSHTRNVSTPLTSSPFSPSNRSTPHKGHGPSASISALDEETRLKLKQIEESSNDPELLNLIKEQQILDDKIAKLRLHKKVLGNELKTLLPKLAVQQKVNSQFSEEIAFHKALKSKRTAHRITVCNWALTMKQRLARCEPSILLKQHRRQAQMFQQFSPNSPNNNTPNGYGSPPSQTNQTPTSRKQSIFSPQTLTVSPTSPYSPLSPTSKLAHSDLIRLSNHELSVIETELLARRPDEPPSSHVLSAFEKEDMMYVDADASLRPPDLSDAFNDDRPRGVSERLAATTISNIDKGATPKSASAPDAVTKAHTDPHYLLLRAHTTALNDFTHLVTNILLREVAIRRQLNLLQHSIYKLTSAKESEFRSHHALTVAEVSSSSSRSMKKTKSSPQPVTRSTQPIDINPRSPIGELNVLIRPLAPLSETPSPHVSMFTQQPM